MKTYTNSEKGQRIFVCCKPVIPKLLEVLKAYCDHVVETADNVRANWKLGDLMPADYWISVADDTAHIIELKKRQMETKKDIFVFELFETPRVFFVCDFISRFSLRLIEDESYHLLIKKLFTT